MHRQPSNPNHIFGETKPGATRRRHNRCHGFTRGNKYAAGAHGNALPDFPDRAGHVRVLKIIGEHPGHIPSAEVCHQEIIVNTGAFTTRGVQLVGKGVDTVKVAIVPKDAASWLLNRSCNGKLRSLRVCRSSLGQGWLAHTYLTSATLSQCEWNSGHGQKQNQITCASNKMRIDGGINVLFDLSGPFGYCSEVVEHSS